jgi:two-component system, NtrC family, nitrogen regulation sensor histidine kinase NtrY
MSSEGAGGRRRPSLTHERRVFLLALLAGLPGVAITLLLLVLGDYSTKVTWTAGTFVIGTWLGVALVLRERVVRPLQTLSNMLAALREGDFSLRARTAPDDDALALAFLEVNMFGETLRTQRLGAMEATALLRTVMAEIDVGIFAFDSTNALRLVNRAGERLLAQPTARLTGKPADAIGLEVFLHGETPRVNDLVFPGGSGRWEIRRTTFRQDGLPHTLVVVADLSKTLREEELLAWQRLVRVLSHEINNSLTPIKSIAGSLQAVLDQQPRAADADEDLRSGLGIIATRSEALSRFMASYARLARLPAPRPGAVNVGVWVRRAAGLETRVPVAVQPGPELVVQADSDQLDQLLINLLRNAADASLETGGAVEVAWRAEDGHIDVEVIDEGPGLSGTANLFVPFYTTKQAGSGIGLVLCRQIAEAHGGVVTLENRDDRRGCVARLRLPVSFRGEY